MKVVFFQIKTNWDLFWLKIIFLTRLQFCLIVTFLGYMCSSTTFGLFFISYCSFIIISLFFKYASLCTYFCISSSIWNYYSIKLGSSSFTSLTDYFLSFSSDSCNFSERDCLSMLNIFMGPFDSESSLSLPPKKLNFFGS